MPLVFRTYYVLSEKVSSWRTLMYRQVNDSDTSHIVDALEGLAEYAKAYPWVGEVDRDKACQAIDDTIAAGKAFVVSGYLVLVDVISPWYTSDSLLEEWLVLKLYKGGSVDHIPNALEELRVLFNCSAVVSGDSSPVNIMAGAYKRAGYLPLTTSFYKAH
jgi:hypothetical protein